MTRTYDDWKTTDPRDMEPPEKPERDPDAEYDAWRDEQLQKAGWEVEGFIHRLTQRDDTNSERLVLEAISHLRGFSRDCDGLRETNARLRSETERALESLQEVEAYLDNRADINDAGGPNEAMRMLVGVRDVIRKLEGR